MEGTEIFRLGKSSTLPGKIQSQPDFRRPDAGPRQAWRKKSARLNYSWRDGN